MKQTSNKDMLNAIRNQASAEYQERIPAVTGEMDARAVLGKLNEYPSAKNEFIKTLTDKVVKTEFFSRVYNNPLKMLKKGTLPYGASIEEIFVQHAQAKGFYKDASGETSQKAGLVGDYDAGSLTKIKPADVKTLYISKNFAYVFEVSISDAQLKSAFLNTNGLSEMVNQLVGSLTSGAELKEYQDMLMLLDAAATGKIPKTLATGELAGSGALTDFIKKGTTDGVRNPMKVEFISEGVGMRNETEGYSHNLAIKLRTYAQKLKFMNKEFNMAGVDTFSNIDDLVFLTTPEHMAEMDVNVLAQAFNISYAEAQLRTIVVDRLPKTFVNKLSTTGGTSAVDMTNAYYNNRGEENQTVQTNLDCLGILIDRNFLQVIDTVNESRQFDNGRALMTNLFLHKQGIMANCYFANAVAFVKKEQ